MSKLSESSIKKIKEQILHELFHNSPQAMFTSEIAAAIIRDEEFIKSLLSALEKESLVTEVSKSSKGKNYSTWRRWTLSKKAYEAYKLLSQPSQLK